MQLITFGFYSIIIATATAAPNPLQIALSLDIETTNTAQEPFCLYVCWPEIPTCPYGWYSNNKGIQGEPCWTCCRAPLSPALESTLSSDDYFVKETLPTASDGKEILTKARPVDICLKMCMPYEPKCAEGWYASGTAGGCWTCCSDRSGESINAGKESIAQPTIDEVSVEMKVNGKKIEPENLQEDPCWMVCWDTVPKCPNRMYSNNKGTAEYPCWTCCIPPSYKLRSIEGLAHTDM